MSFNLNKVVDKYHEITSNKIIKYILVNLLEKQPKVITYILQK